MDGEQSIHICTHTHTHNVCLYISRACILPSLTETSVRGVCVCVRARARACVGVCTLTEASKRGASLGGAEFPPSLPFPHQ